MYLCKSDKINQLHEFGLQFCVNAFSPDFVKDVDVYNTSTDLLEIQQKALEAQNEFDEIICDTLSQKRMPEYLNNLFQTQEEKAQVILNGYAEIITKMNESLNQEDTDYRLKLERQGEQHKNIRKRIINFIAELNKTGKEEVELLREAITAHSKQASEDLLKRNEVFLNESAADKPFDSYLWETPTSLLNFQHLKDAFLINQEEVFNIKKSLLSEICKHRNKLENDKLTYNLQKQTLEQDTFFLQQKCEKHMPLIAESKKKRIHLRDKKIKLQNELIHVNEMTQSDIKLNQTLNLKFQKICAYDERLPKNQFFSKYQKVFEEKKTEAYILLTEILDAEKIICEAILFISWTPFDNIRRLNKGISLFGARTDTDYWKDFLDVSSLLLPLLGDIQNVMEYMRLELSKLTELMKTNESLQLQSRTLRALLRNYNKFIK